MSQISAYVEEEGLGGCEVLLYVDLPALSYYLNIPPAFNSWSDLDSYSLAALESEMEELEEEVQAGARMPVVILEKSYKDYYVKAKEEPKFGLILSFMEQHAYVETFENEKFLVLEASED